MAIGNRLTFSRPGGRRRSGRFDDLPEGLERDFDRRALLPRLLVLGVLAAGALLEYGHGHRVGHWIVLIVYGLTTVAMAVSSRASTSRWWLPWAATVADAGLTVYVIADHLPQDAHDALHATDAVSLLPAFLLLLQTGLRLRRDLVAAFAGIVLVGWIGLLLVFIGSDTLFAFEHETSVSTRQTLGIASFSAAAGFVLYAVHRMRLAAAAVLKARFDRLLLSRFLPEGIATEVVRGEDTTEVMERHVCLLSVDIRGFSARTRERPSSETIATLMEFRRLVHEAVSSRRGIIDKYLGDGVLALFLEGPAEDQAASALAAVIELFRRVELWNTQQVLLERSGIRIIACLHRGFVLAGVFDDGNRAEFTVLGPAVNALSRMERRAKEAGIDVLTSKRLTRLLPPSSLAGLGMRRLDRRPGDEELPDVYALTIGGSHRALKSHESPASLPLPRNLLEGTPR